MPINSAHLLAARLILCTLLSAGRKTIRGSVAERVVLRPIRLIDCFDTSGFSVRRPSRRRTYTVEPESFHRSRVEAAIANNWLMKRANTRTARHPGEMLPASIAAALECHLDRCVELHSS